MVEYQHDKQGIYLFGMILAIEFNAFDVSGRYLPRYNATLMRGFNDINAGNSDVRPGVDECAYIHSTTKQQTCLTNYSKGQEQAHTPLIHHSLLMEISNYCGFPEIETTACNPTTTLTSDVEGLTLKDAQCTYYYFSRDVV